MDGYHLQFIGMHAYWWIFWLLLIVPFFFFATPVRRRTAQLYRENPLGILQRRYASGEITTEDYEDRKARLERDLRDPQFRDPKAQPMAPGVPSGASGA